MEAMNIGLLGSALGRIFGFYKNSLRTLGGPRACGGESLHPGVYWIYALSSEGAGCWCC